MDKRDYYSKSNPHGPYSKVIQRPNETHKPPYIEGQATQKNIDQWAEYASKNSPGKNPKRGD
jgi:hypothetical protein